MRAAEPASKQSPLASSISAELCSELHSVWSCSAAPNRIRSFAFQFYNNSLPVGSRLSARYRADNLVNIDERCTFCVRGNLGAAAREDFMHLFYNCPTVTPCVAKYIEKYGENVDTIEGKKLFVFTGSGTGEVTRDSSILALTSIIFCYLIWENKVRKKIPSFTTIENSMLTIFDTILSISKSLSGTALASTAFICRSWRARTGRG